MHLLEIMFLQTAALDHYLSLELQIVYLPYTMEPEDEVEFSLPISGGSISYKVVVMPSWGWAPNSCIWLRTEGKQAEKPFILDHAFLLAPDSWKSVLRSEVSDGAVVVIDKLLS